jgi:hypothetical protein
MSTLVHAIKEYVHGAVVYTPDPKKDYYSAVTNEDTYISHLFLWIIDTRPGAIV